jgi:RimJ/RimL family protein N-acetyltransferase
MEKCGMRREAHFIRNRTGREPGIWYDEFIYALLREKRATGEEAGR